MIIVDASVAVKWVVSEPGSAAAAKLLKRRLAAPALWLSEASNALWAKAMRGQLTADEARGQAADLADAPVMSLALPGLLPIALSAALDLGHPIYDCFYLSAAIQKDTYVVTADRRFHDTAIARVSFADRVRLLEG